MRANSTRAIARRSGLAMALMLALGSAALAQIQQNPNLPPRPDSQIPEPLTTDDGAQTWGINDHATAHRPDKDSPWSMTDLGCDPDHPDLSPTKTTRECRVDPESGEPYWYETTYQEYTCARAPLRRRFISDFKKLGRCRRFDYGTSYALAQSTYDEHWPLPPEEVEDPPPEPPGEPPPGEPPPGGGDGSGGGKLVHDSLLDKGCFMKHLWELWFDAFAKGQTPKQDVDIPAVPWSSFYSGSGGVDHYQMPGGQDLLKLPNGEVLEKTADGAWIQVCPPESSTATAAPPAPGATSSGSQPPPGADQPPGSGPPTSGDSGDGETGQVPGGCPGAGTLASGSDDCEPGGLNRRHAGQNDNGNSHHKSK